MKRIITLLLLTFSIVVCHAQQRDYTKLRKQLERTVSRHKATIGLAVIHIENNDTFTINNDKDFPMQSVYKFPEALYILYLVDQGKLSLDQKIHVSKADVTPETWSPIRSRYPNGEIDLTLAEVLYYAVSASDNIACDLLFRTAKGTQNVEIYIHQLGFTDIHILSTEDEMHHDSTLQFRNTSSPLSMSKLLTGFYKHHFLSDSSSALLMKLMTESTNSPKRIKGALPEGTVVAHKTGTGGESYDNIRSACNDVGIITLPDGKHIAITVFVTQSKAPLEKDEKVIAKLSKTVFDFYSK
jgi:beta-lactamase class A